MKLNEVLLFATPFFLPTFEIKKKKTWKIARYKTVVEITVVTEELNSSQI